MRTLKLISRISAWLLLFGIVMLSLSGWGITRAEFMYQATAGLIDRGTANDIHLFLQIPVTSIALLHVLTRIRISLDRKWSTNKWVLNGILGAAGIAALAFVIYLEYFA